MIEKEYFYNEDELFDLNIVKGTYITFKFISDHYVLEGNKQGLKSFVRILNKLIYKKYDWIRLLDLSINEYYTNAPEYFFDEPSIPLQIGKIKRKKDILYDDYDCKMYGRTLDIYLTRKNLLYLKEQILELLDNRNLSEKIIVIKNINDIDYQKLLIRYKDVKPIRKYD